LIGQDKTETQFWVKINKIFFIQTLVILP